MFNVEICTFHCMKCEVLLKHMASDRNLFILQPVFHSLLNGNKIKEKILSEIDENFMAFDLREF